MQEKYSCLFSFVIDEDILVANFISTENALDIFHLPLSNQAYQEWQQLQGTTTTLQLSAENDSWIYKWGENI